MIKKFLLLICFPFLVPAQTWQQLPDFPSTKRDDGVAVVVNNKAYVGTGLQEWNTTIDFYSYDHLTNKWKSISTMPHTTERQYACAFAGNNCFYIFGGDGVGGSLNDIYKYEVITDKWSAMTPRSGQGIIGASSFTFGDKTIICGGKYQSGKRNYEVWEYNATTNSWLKKNNFPYPPVLRASAAVIRGPRDGAPV